MAERGWSGGHPTEGTLGDFANGKLDPDGEIAIEDHLMFDCPGGRCCRLLHRHPNAIDAVLRAAARSCRAGQRRVSCTS